ncbi:DUF1351 domain-containing protein [uncultured Pseudodesulfovibrio sp.]|uniref:DUF1351 domain-containing protein n=1 Tax=uncultured Pseudodesulfovibrio sp. TaxID=2035858 RepID=UPI0029C8F5CA|nr:DUF1351 domain-containing protein [uncultured Pseudodesulfovibrio sp.]
MTMELKIISPAEDGFVKSIDFNFDELKGELTNRLEKYQGLAYTDDSIQDAKKDRATLNKFKKALNDKKLEIKRRCLEPYDSFETRIKELIALVEQPVLAIDSQVKGYEERKRTEKQQTIQAVWDVQESDVKSMVTLANVFDQRWLNVTYSMAQIEQEITDFLKKVEEELNLIYDLNTEHEDQVIRVYLKGFNVAAALAEDKALKDAAAKQEAYRKQREEAKAAAEAEEKARREAAAQAAPEPPAQPEPPRQSAPAAAPQTQPEPVTHCVEFRVWATGDQLTALGNFMNANGIKYGRVEDRQAA